MFKHLLLIPEDMNMVWHFLCRLLELSGVKDAKALKRLVILTPFRPTTDSFDAASAGCWS